MKTEEDYIKEIEEMSDEQVLRAWRFEPSGSPYTVGKAGMALCSRMTALQKKEYYSLISKRVGW